MLAKPAVFNRIVYFTTYTYTETKDPCAVAGISKAYIVEYLSGGGALNVDDLSDFFEHLHERSQEIGSGAPSAPVITINMKGKASVIIGTTSGQIFSQGGIFSYHQQRNSLLARSNSVTVLSPVRFKGRLIRKSTVRSLKVNLPYLSIFSPSKEHFP